MEVAAAAAESPASSYLAAALHAFVHWAAAEQQPMDPRPE